MSSLNKTAVPPGVTVDRSRIAVDCWRAHRWRGRQGHTQHRESACFRYIRFREIDRYDPNAWLGRYLDQRMPADEAAENGMAALERFRWERAAAFERQGEEGDPYYGGRPDPCLRPLAGACLDHEGMLSGHAPHPPAIISAISAADLASLKRKLWTSVQPSVRVVPSH
jgi:hypothetical protein